MLKVVSKVYTVVFFFKQKTAYEMRISDWSSDVCSSDLAEVERHVDLAVAVGVEALGDAVGVGIDELGHAGGAWPGQRHVGGAVAVEVERVGDAVGEIGRASCRERVCRYV